MVEQSVMLKMDPEVIADFRDSFDEHYEIIANCIARLETGEHQNADLIDELFRSLHTVKGNASMTQMDRLAQFAHATEEIVDAMREGAFEYTPMIGEIILLTLDKIKEVSEDYFVDCDINTELLDQVEVVINELTFGEAQERNQKAALVITLITGQDINGLEHAMIGTSSGKSPPSMFTPLEDAKPAMVISAEQHLALNQFRLLSQLLEKKLPYWADRGKRILPLALELNRALQSPEDPLQLEAAVYTHDIAFAFLSDFLILKEGKFDEDEMQHMREHPRIASQFIGLIPGWQAAMIMIEQHHEKWDGSGYPKGLRENAVCPGAQILAVVDAYESMTHPRPDRQYKRSVLRAVSEINNCNGTQFSPQLTAHFNEIIRASFKQ